MLEHLPESRRVILLALARHGPQSVKELAPRVFGSATNVRTVLLGLEHDGFVSCRERTTAGRGRPTKAYRLTRDGWHLFPNRSDFYAAALMRLMSERDPEGFSDALRCVQDTRAESILKATGLPPGRGAVLRTLEAAFRGGWGVDDLSDGATVQAVFFHCPIFHLALEFPALCEAHGRILSAIAGVPADLTEHRLTAGDNCVFTMDFADVISGADT